MSRAKPADLLMEQSMHDKLIINLKMAQALGLEGLALVITNIRLTGAPQARESYALLQRRQLLAPRLPCVLISGEPMDQGIPEVRAGAVRLLVKPFLREPSCKHSADTGSLARCGSLLTTWPSSRMTEATIHIILHHDSRIFDQSGHPPLPALPCHRLSLWPSERKLGISLPLRSVSLEVSMTRLPTQEFAAFVGIDWAEATHAICWQVAGSNPRESRVLEHPLEATDAWARALRHRFGSQPIAVCLEVTKGPMVSALHNHDSLVRFPANPLTVAQYRAACTPSRAKDGPSDAEIQLQLLLKDRDKFQALPPPTATMHALEQLVEYGRRLVGDKVRLTNRLTSALKRYIPQVLPWLSDKDTALFCEFLTQGPTLKAAIPLTMDEGGITPHVCLVRALAAQLRALVQAIEGFDRAMAQLAPRHPDFALFQALSGAGPVVAPRVLVAFGEQRERYASATAIQKSAGIAPVTDRRGSVSYSAAGKRKHRTTNPCISRPLRGEVHP